MEKYFKVPSKHFSNVAMRVIPGHFVTPNSHINYYMDFSQMKYRMSEAQAAADALAEFYRSDTIVDTIVCLDGMDIIGAYLAEELTKAGVISMNQHKSIYVLQPEFNPAGQMIFWEKIQGWITGKNVLLLLGTATTGKTLSQSVESLKYYGASISGIAAIFSVVSKVAGTPVRTLFSPADLPDYTTYSHDDCPLCKAGKPVDAMCNGYGYTALR